MRQTVFCKSSSSRLGDTEQKVVKMTFIEKIEHLFHLTEWRIDCIFANAEKNQKLKFAGRIRFLQITIIHLIDWIQIKLVVNR